MSEVDEVSADIQSDILDILERIYWIYLRKKNYNDNLINVRYTQRCTYIRLDSVTVTSIRYTIKSTDS